MTAVGQAQHAGFLCDVYQFETTINGNAWLIKAFANAKTRELYSIAAWPDANAVTTQAPFAELQFVARDIPFAEDKFKVANTFSADGRIGKIVDAQGTALLRPLTSSRWTPVAGSMVLKPGDWVRTEIRGANAVAIELTSRFRCVWEVPGGYFSDKK